MLELLCHLDHQAMSAIRLLIIDAVNKNELYKLNKSNLIGNKQVLLRELQYYLHYIIWCYNSVT